MSKTTIGIGSFVLGILVVVVFLSLTGGGATFGAQIQNDIFWFSNGINIGGTSPAKLTASGSTLLTSGGITASGALSATTISGTTGTYSGTSVTVGAGIASSSIILGGGTSATKIFPGCIELGDAMVTSTMDYITASSGVVVISTSKPAGCQ